MTQTSTARKLTSSKSATRVNSRPKSIREENLDKPATRRQRFALMCAFRRLGRRDNPWEMELTMGDAHALLNQLNQNPVTAAPVRKAKATMYDLLKARLIEDMPRLAGALRSTLGIKSVVKNDTNFMKDDGKRYLFVGTGCSIVYLTYDKRSKKAKEIEDAAYKLRHDLMPTLLTYFDSETIHYYAEHGCPLQAVAMQDMHCNQTFWSIVLDFMEKQGVKRVRMESRYD